MKIYKNHKDIYWKLLSTLSSSKTWLLFFSGFALVEKLIGSTEFVVLAGACIGLKQVQKYTELKAANGNGENNG